jgi:hypothetical protein
LWVHATGNWRCCLQLKALLVDACQNEQKTSLAAEGAICDGMSQKTLILAACHREMKAVTVAECHGTLRQLHAIKCSRELKSQQVSQCYRSRKRCLLLGTTRNNARTQRGNTVKNSCIYIYLFMFSLFCDLLIHAVSNRNKQRRETDGLRIIFRNECWRNRTSHIWSYHPWIFQKAFKEMMRTFKISDVQIWFENENVPHWSQKRCR